MEATCARESAGRNPMTSILTGCATAAIEARTLRSRSNHGERRCRGPREGTNAGQPDTTAFVGGHANQATAAVWKPTGRGRPRPVSS